MLRNYTDLELRIREFGRKITREEEGASLVEYALLVALIAIVVLVALGPLGSAIKDVFTEVEASVSSTT